MTAPPLNRKLRAKLITGSDIPALLGVGRRRSALDVFVAKTADETPEPDDVSEAEAEWAAWGHRLEPVILDVYATTQGYTLDAPLRTLIHPIETWAGGTPDGLVVGQGGRLVAGANPTLAYRFGVDAKNRDRMVADQWGEAGTDQVPLDVAAQCVWYMFLTDLPRWDVAVLFGGNHLRVYRLHRDRELETEIVETARRFWTEHVQTGEPPALTPPDAATRYLKRRYPFHDEQLIPANAAATDTARALRDVRERLAALTAEKDELEVTLKTFIGPHAGVVGPWGKITWRKTAGGGIDYKGLVATLGVSSDLIERFQRPGYRRLHVSFTDEG